MGMNPFMDFYEYVEKYFEDFIPISLDNSAYKIVSKITSLCLNTILSRDISHEQFGFLKGRTIHEAIGSTQEGIHSLKRNKHHVAILKLDILKDFERVSWFFLRLVILQIRLISPSNWAQY